MSFSGDLVAGIAQLLDAADAGSWQPTGAYSESTDRPIFVREAPNKPDRAIVLTHYPVTAERRTTDVVEGIQVRNRGLPGDPRTADDDADAIRAALDGLQHINLAGRHVSLIEWRSGAPLGQDSNRRWENTQNFYLFTARPSPHRED